MFIYKIVEIIEGFIVNIIGLIISDPIIGIIICSILSCFIVIIVYLSEYISNLYIKLKIKKLECFMKDNEFIMGEAHPVPLNKTLTEQMLQLAREDKNNELFDVIKQDCKYINSITVKRDSDKTKTITFNYDEREDSMQSQIKKNNR